MADEMEMEVPSAAEVVSSLFELHGVSQVAMEPDNIACIVTCDVTDYNGYRSIITYALLPSDNEGYAPTIRQWLIDHEGEYTVIPYTPPTAEELRALMPALSRSVFRLKFKNAGMTTAFINGVIAAIEDESLQEDMQIVWEDQQSFGRLDPFVIMVAEAKPKTPAQIDSIWLA